VWRDLAADPETRRILADEGVTDEMWSAIDDNMQKLEGRVFLQEGKLAAEVRLAGQDRAHQAVFGRTPGGRSVNVSDLLRRGQFERLVEEFSRGAPLPPALDVVGGDPHEVDLAEIDLSGTLLASQLMAQHRRKLEDTGLAVQSGNAVFLAVAAGVVLAGLIGKALMDHYCPEPGGLNAAACVLGLVLFFAAMVAMMVLVVILVDKLDSLNVQPVVFVNGVPQPSYPQ